MPNFLSLLALSITTIASIFIIYQDCKYQQFHIVWAIVFLVGSGLWSYTQAVWPVTPLYLLLFSLILQTLWFLLRHKPAFGMGDIVLFFGAGFWVSNIFLFIFLCGLIGVVTKMLYSPDEKFPFAPAIILAGWLITIYARF